MWRAFKILITILFLFSLNIVHAQYPMYLDSGIPLKQYDSPLFGKDIIIDNNPDRNQRQVSLYSSFNGWLYALYSYTRVTNSTPAFTILRSNDNGITWTVFIDDYYGLPNSKFTSIDFIISGDSISNLKLFLAFVVSNSESTGLGDARVWRFNGETGVFEDGILQDNFSHSIAIASDFIYPATNSNPRSIGILYSKYYNNGDSILFRSSSNGGMTLDNRRAIASSAVRFQKVALSFGRSLSMNSGRYFAAWEEKHDFNSNTGHIYTSHTEPYFNSPFTTPVMLDNLDTSAFNNARNPVIACQYNNIDNDSLNITEVVLFEKYLAASDQYDIVGFYNMKPTSSNNFKKFILSSFQDNKQQSSVNFNPFDSTFMVTYYNSTTQKLPFLLNNFNLAYPDAWQVVNSGYNDDSNLSAPYPRVALNIGQQQGANIWSSEETGGKGVALFDAPYSTYTGISDINNTDETSIVKMYPNPCNQKIYFSFELNKSEFVRISVQSTLGYPIVIITNHIYPEGKNTIQYDVSNLPTGFYLYKFDSENGIKTTGKFIVLR
jgi:hypothetical protein